MSSALSPCVLVCTLDDTANLCLGCMRTLDEIAGWALLDDAARETVMAALSARRPAIHPPNPGDA
ncbi:DUF1289 domain-containing protein [Phenylobacterium immobile]|uniref:DUF1289 domain-containing protein n=1 Tax=Phenylobacterium immobile TaxID=21 RepID=UPI000AC5CA10|nr:DUF1289 domain-containing protein [Phenylobacterium immobile]